MYVSSYSFLLPPIKYTDVHSVNISYAFLLLLSDVKVVRYSLHTFIIFYINNKMYDYMHNLDAIKLLPHADVIS